MYVFINPDRPKSQTVARSCLRAIKPACGTEDRPVSLDTTVLEPSGGVVSRAAQPCRKPPRAVVVVAVVAVVAVGVAE